MSDEFEADKIIDEKNKRNAEPTLNLDATKVMDDYINESKPSYEELRKELNSLKREMEDSDNKVMEQEKIIYNLNCQIDSMVGIASNLEDDNKNLELRVTKLLDIIYKLVMK